MPHPINSYLAGNIEGQAYILSMGLREERFIEIDPQDIYNNYDTSYFLFSFFIYKINCNCLLKG